MAAQEQLQSSTQGSRGGIQHRPSNGHYPDRECYPPKMSLGSPPAPSRPPFIIQSANWLIPLIISGLGALWGTAIFYYKSETLRETIAITNANLKSAQEDIIDIKVFIGRQDSVNASIANTLSDIRNDVRSLRRGQ